MVHQFHVLTSGSLYVIELSNFISLSKFPVENKDIYQPTCVEKEKI